LTSSLVASGDWGRGGAKKWVGFGREKRERERNSMWSYLVYEEFVPSQVSFISRVLF
jgi:hypothetical protein